MFSKIGAFIKPLISGRDAVPTTQPERVHRVGEDTVDGRPPKVPTSPQEEDRRKRDPAGQRETQDSDVMTLSLAAVRVMVTEDATLAREVDKYLDMIDRLEKSGVTELEISPDKPLAAALTQAVSLNGA